MAAKPVQNWPGPRLLVPITVEALVISEAAQNATWSRQNMNYVNLGRFQPVAPLPDFDPSTQSPPPTGVTLAWALPDALTHGIETGGTIDYPVLPNRWLVLRLYPGQNHTAGAKQVRGWVLQSDCIHADTDTGRYGSPFVNPEDPAESSNYRIGLAFTLEKWIDPATRKPSGRDCVLRALGAGDATFAAYAPNIQDVFVFHDPLDDVAQGALTYLVAGWYGDPDQDPLRDVTADQPRGWTDPRQWLQLMQRMGWSVGSYDLQSAEVKNAAAAGQRWLKDHLVGYHADDPQSQFAAQILCHGLVYDVNWTGTMGEAQLGVPKPKASDVDIAVGNTAVDALAALIQKHLGDRHPHAGELLQAFQSKLLNELDQLGFDARLLEGIRQAWFGESQTGRLWQIIEPERPDPATSRVEEAPQVSHALKQLLAELNQIQMQINTATALLQQAQGELYRAWWKRQAYDKQFPRPSGVTRDQVSAAFDSALSLVNQTNETLRPLRQARDTRVQEICAEIGGQIQKDPATGEVGCQTADETRQLRLVSSPAPRFWHPADPVILIQGVTRTYKHGEDGRFEDDGTLFCRFSGQTLSSITVNTVIGKSGTQCEHPTDCYTVTDDDLKIRSQVEIGQTIPLEVLDLLLEAYLLDTTNAGQIAAMVLRGLNKTEPQVDTLAGQVAREQTLGWNPALHPALDKRTMADLCSLNGGIMPSKLAVESWSPPWAPLFMDWEVRWVPSYNDPQQVLVDKGGNPWWALDAAHQDFTWKGPTPPDFSNRMTFRGRTVITPNATQVFAAALEKFLQDHSDADLELREEFLEKARALDGGDGTDGQDYRSVLNAVLEVIRNWNILSQSISGFNQLLLMRDITQRPLPSEGISDLIGAQADAGPSTSANPSFFNPIRAGHLQISNLWVVDDFGQVFNAVGEKGVIREISPVRATGLATAGTSMLIELPPRIIQDGRIQFRFIAANGDDTAEAVSNPLANPVCGWLLPNHLDRSLMIYDTDGTFNGEVLVTGEGTRRRARWLAAPDKSAAVGAAPDIANRYMSDFVTGLLNRSDSAAALSDLLAAIDSSLWTIDPLGDRDHQNLSVLIGRPLALVRARLNFELAGPPAVDQSWQQTNHNETREFCRTRFPINLGNFQLRDDGLLGYFVQADFSQFRTVYMPADLKARQPAYLVQKDIWLPFNYPTQADPYTVAIVFLLLDPRGGIHAQTGLFPNKKIVLPALYVDEPIQKINVTFRTGPLLTAADTVRMPIPAEIDGIWSWIEHSGIEILERKIQKADDRARLANVPAGIREGWLKLSEVFKTRNK